MRTRNNICSPLAYRIDPLGNDRLQWLQSFLLHCGERPSNSVIIRRAIALYVEHIDKMMKDTDKTRLELIQLKAHTGGDPSPWPTPPAFDGQTFAKILSKRRKEQQAENFQAIQRFLESKAPCVESIHGHH